MIKIFRSKRDLVQHVEEVLNNRTFDASHDDLRDALVSVIYRLNTPLWGADWSDFLASLDWDALIAEAEGDVAWERKEQARFDCVMTAADRD
jgi:hypothetical protein